MTKLERVYHIEALLEQLHSLSVDRRAAFLGRLESVDPAAHAEVVELYAGLRDWFGDQSQMHSDSPPDPMPKRPRETTLSRWRDLRSAMGIVVALAVLMSIMMPHLELTTPHTDTAYENSTRPAHNTTQRHAWVMSTSEFSSGAQVTIQPARTPRGPHNRSIRRID